MEMRTAPLETRAAKSMRFNDKNNFVAAKFVLSRMSTESALSESEFYSPSELSDTQNYISRQRTAKIDR